MRREGTVRKEDRGQRDDTAPRTRQAILEPPRPRATISCRSRVTVYAVTSKHPVTVMAWWGGEEVVQVLRRRKDALEGAQLSEKV